MKNYKDLILKTENIKPKIDEDIKSFVDLLIKQPYVEGIVFLGGLGKRNFLDSHSDVDIAIFYDLQTRSNHYLPFEFHATINGKKYEFNIRQLFFDKEISSEWDEAKKEAYSKALVIYDKKNRIKKLIRNKILFNKKAAYYRIIFILQQYVWRGQIHSLRTLYRGYPEGSHDLLNECLELLVEGIYLLNERHRPHRKWRVAVLTTMDKLPDNFIELLRNAMQIKDFSEKDIRRRISTLDKIYRWVEAMARQKYPNFPENPYEYYFKKFYQLRPDCFAQKMSRILCRNGNDECRQELEGNLCLNLISNKRQLDKINNIIKKYNGNS